MRADLIMEGHRRPGWQKEINNCCSLIKNTENMEGYLSRLDYACHLFQMGHVIQRVDLQDSQKMTLHALYLK